MELENEGSKMRPERRQASILISSSEISSIVLQLFPDLTACVAVDTDNKTEEEAPNMGRNRHVAASEWWCGASTDSELGKAEPQMECCASSGHLSSGSCPSSSLAQRLASLLDTGRCSDIVICVGAESGKKKEFQVHKAVLASCSPVFEAMFFGPLAEENGRVDVPDVDGQTFSRLLDFAYQDNADVCSLGGDEAWALWYAANKYLVWPLAQRCMKHLTSIVCVENVLALYEKALEYGVGEIETRCLTLIDQKACEVLSQGSFSQLGLPCALKLLSRPSLEASETHLFLAALRWAQHAASEDRPEGDSLQETAAPLLACLQLENISPDDLVRHVLPSGLLQPEQQSALLLPCLRRLLPSPLVTETRRSSCAVLCQRASSAVPACEPPGRDHLLRFRLLSCPKGQAFFRGIRIMNLDAVPRCAGAFNYYSSFSASLTLRLDGKSDGEKRGAEGEGSCCTEGGVILGQVRQRGLSFPFDLELNCPVGLDPFPQIYLLHLQISDWELPTWPHALSQAPVVRCQGLEVEFLPEPRSTITTPEGGLIPALYFFASTGHLPSDSTPLSEMDSRKEGGRPAWRD